MIDDGSLNDTVATIQSFNDERVRLISTEQSGIPKSRNLGVRMSKGEYVVIMDDDDLMLPHRLREQVNCLTPGSAGVMEGGLIRIQIWSLNIILARTRVTAKSCLEARSCFTASMIKRDVLLEFPYDENYSFGTDYVMNLEIARARSSIKPYGILHPLASISWRQRHNYQRR